MHLIKLLPRHLLHEKIGLIVLGYISLRSACARNRFLASFQSTTGSPFNGWSDSAFVQKSLATFPTGSFPALTAFAALPNRAERCEAAFAPRPPCIVDQSCCTRQYSATRSRRMDLLSELGCDVYSIAAAMVNAAAADNSASQTTSCTTGFSVLALMRRIRNAHNILRTR